MFQIGVRGKIFACLIVAWKTKITAHVQAHFSARAEIPFRLHEIFSDFQARFTGLKANLWYALTRISNNLICSVPETGMVVHLFWPSLLVSSTGRCCLSVFFEKERLCVSITGLIICTYGVCGIASVCV